MNKEITGYPSQDRLFEKESGLIKSNPIIPSINIYNAIKTISVFYRKETAIECDELSINYNELLENVAIISRSLKELGVKKGDIVSASLPNYAQAVAIFLATNRIGATLTFLNPHASIDEIIYYLNLFESSLFFDFNKSLDYNKKIKESTKVRQTITLKKDQLNDKLIIGSKDVNGYNDFLEYNDLESLSKKCHDFLPLNTSGTDDALILFTSGSTGNPKPVVLTNKNILASGIYMKNSTNLTNTKGERTLVCVPFTYPYGFATSTLMSLLCGRTALLGPNISKDTISYYLAKNPNIIFGSPALLELIKRNIPNDMDLSSINTFISGGDFLTESSIKMAEEYFQSHNARVDICNGSGNAETVGASTNSVGIPKKPGTVGQVLIGERAIVIDPESKKELKYGEEGTLCISGKNVFKEYYKLPEETKTAKFIYKGREYLNTGTRGILDESGYFTLTGRSTRFFIMATLNKVYCDHIQNAISSIDIVESCAVVKEPHPDLLFVPKVYIVLKDGVPKDDSTKDLITNLCNNEMILPASGEKVLLKDYEIPQSIEFIDELPRTKADKIDYSILEQAAERKEKTAIRKLTI